ncbi:MAG: FkbM family methyltransferase [Clostridiales bacterium]|jgi:FkbM family methyltransferase|nr:FkbM family methyltransferase [Clostridiales bacterium]
MHYLFPFHLVPKGSRVAIYGFGIVGRTFLAQIQSGGYCEAACVCDRNYKNIDSPSQRVGAPSDLARAQFDWAVIAIENPAVAGEARSLLLASGVPAGKIIHDVGLIMPFTEASYSQHAADRIAENIFEILKIPDVTYLEIGANHPAIGSNTFLFYGKGHRGVAVDANGAFREMWAQIRPGDAFACTAVGGGEGRAQLFVRDPRQDALHGHSTLKREIADLFDVSDTLDVPVTTLDRIVAEYCGGAYPQFMSIDIEGMEYEALACSDLSAGPAVAAVEIDKSDIAKMNELMAGKGYFAYCRTVGDMVYVKEKYRETLFTKLTA